MLELKRVLKAIAPEEKTELKSEKVELAKLSELDNVARDVVRINNKVLDQNRKLRNELEGLKAASRAAIDAIADYERMKSELKQAAKEFGFDISNDIKGAEQQVKAAEQDVKDIKKRWGI